MPAAIKKSLSKNKSITSNDYQIRSMTFNGILMIQICSFIVVVFFENFVKINFFSHDNSNKKSLLWIIDVQQSADYWNYN